MVASRRLLTNITIYIADATVTHIPMDSRFHDLQIYIESDIHPVAGNGFHHLLLA
jgi:hypothetical protein